jgi:hypothetical protein
MLEVGWKCARKLIVDASLVVSVFRVRTAGGLVILELWCAITVCTRGVVESTVWIVPFLYM